MPSNFLSGPRGPRGPMPDPAVPVCTDLQGRFPPGALAPACFSLPCGHLMPGSPAFSPGRMPDICCGYRGTFGVAPGAPVRRGARDVRTA